MRTRTSITETEIQEALRRFRERGGMVRRLPAEFVPRPNRVGWRHGAFENPLIDTSPVDPMR